MSIDTPRKDYQALVIILSAIVGVIAVVAVAAAVLVLVKVDRQVQQDSRILADITSTRYSSVYDRCRQIEQLKVDARLVFRRFGITHNELPIRPNGGRAFDPTPGGCAKQTSDLLRLRNR